MFQIFSIYNDVCIKSRNVNWTEIFAVHMKKSSFGLKPSKFDPVETHKVGYCRICHIITNNSSNEYSFVQRTPIGRHSFMFD